MSKERIYYLLHQYAGNQATREEVEELFEWLKTGKGEETLKHFILDAQIDGEREIRLPQPDWDTIWQSVQSATIQPPKKLFSMRWVSVAAAVLLLIMAGSAGGFLCCAKKKTTPPLFRQENKKKNKPRGN